MASTSGSRPKPRTRQASGTKTLRDYAGPGKPFDQSEVPTYRSIGALAIISPPKIHYSNAFFKFCFYRG